MRKAILLSLLILYSVSLSVSAQKVQYYEKCYQDTWCAENKGKTEVYLSDRARVDCVTDTHALEVDFAYKWAEGIGQSLYYANMTGKKPGVLLIMENWGRDQKYLNGLNNVCNKYGVKVWSITPSSVSDKNIQSCNK